ncbi:thaumatin-like protein [Moniliophthora roreri MCA 2997]|uniref:Thaumatin-like protein n=2 Tax=Moniliophthora roreri TaxID=221103 RepID=V2XDN7_MONRO|nr:thaumatin-like protein [Moniliophthora roreri MCA 2997]
MDWLFIILLVSTTILLAAEARSLTVKNNCAFTVWPAIFTPSSLGGSGTSQPDSKTGWEATAGSEVTFSVPNNWQAGRIWGRRDCDFSRTPPLTCASGSCNGGLECTSTGVPPTTSAEFTLASGSVPDYYDVSLSDGFNLPMQITNNVKCPVAECTVDLNAACPRQLQGNTTSDGTVSGCLSSCLANLDGRQTNSPNCCTGDNNSPTNCTAAGVQFFDYFKGRCPNALAYAFDEAALWTCDGKLEANYTVTFCP